MVSRANRESRPQEQSVDGGGKVKKPEVGMGVAWAQSRKGSGGGGGGAPAHHDTSDMGGSGSSDSLSKGSIAVGEAIGEYGKRRKKKKSSGTSGA